MIGKIPSYDGWFGYSFGPVYRDGYLHMGKAVRVRNSGKPIRQLGKDNGTVVKGFKTARVIHVLIGGLKSRAGKDLLYNETWYTPDNIPGAGDSITIPRARSRSGVHFLRLANGGRERIKRIVL